MIDNYPGEGTWPLMAARVSTFFGLCRRQFFYEPLASYDVVLSCLRLIAEERDLFIPEHCIDHPLIVFEVFEGALTARRGRLEEPRNGEPSRGLHAVALAGWDDDGDSLIFRNSWGTQWGNCGYGSVSRDYLGRFLREAWVHRNVRFGLSRFTFERFATATRPAERRAILLQENPRTSFPIQYAGRRYRVFVYETLSFQEECPVEILELRNGQGLRLAWTEIFHLPRARQPTRTVAKEFFVWPQFRRRGYGTILEAAAVLRAAAWGSNRVEVLLHEPDGRLSVRGQARQFASKHNYQWLWRRTAVPPVAATAHKSVDPEAAHKVLRPAARGYAAFTTRAGPKDLN